MRTQINKKQVIKIVKIEGKNPVIEAIKGKRNIDKIMIKKGIKDKKIDWILKQARSRQIDVEFVSGKTLDNIAGSSSPQGIIALAEQKKLVGPADIINFAREQGKEPFVVILDQIQDPYNFGAIIRTAHCAGAHGVIFQERRAVGITPVVLKSSAGAVEHIKLAQVTNINNTIDILKEEGLWIAGADMEGKKLHFQADLKGAIGIVIGSEGRGLRRLVKEKCDFLVRIPITGKISSLNASSAAAVVIYEAVRQRYHH